MEGRVEALALYKGPHQVKNKVATSIRRALGKKLESKGGSSKKGETSNSQME